jgi:hypothetical protein
MMDGMHVEAINIGSSDALGPLNPRGQIKIMWSDGSLLVGQVVVAGVGR